MTVKVDLDFIANIAYSMAFGSPYGSAEPEQLEFEKYSPYLNNSKAVEENALWFEDVEKTLMYQEYTDFLGRTYSNRGFFIENKGSKKALIHIHGFKGSAESAQYTAKTYYDLGYSIFFADMRGQGKGEDPQRNVGIQDVDDTFNWIKRLTQERGIEEFIVAGLSQGGGVVLNIVSHPDCPSSIKAAISDSGFLSMETAIRYALSGQGKLSSPLLPDLTGEEQDILYHKVDDLLFKYQGVRIAQGTNEERLKKAKVPLLVFYGETDAYFPVSFGPAIYEVYGADPINKSHVFFAGVGHITGAFKYYELYASAIEMLLQERGEYPVINQKLFNLSVDNKDDYTDEELDFSPYFTAFDAIDGDISDKITFCLPEGITKERIGLFPLEVSVENSRGKKLILNSSVLTKVIYPMQMYYYSEEHVFSGRFINDFPKVDKLELYYELVSKSINSNAFFSGKLYPEVLDAKITQSNELYGEHVNIALDEHGFEYKMKELDEDPNLRLERVMVTYTFSNGYGTEKVLYLFA